MKKSLLLSLAVMSSSAFAGTAYIPFWQADNYGSGGYTCFRFSNVSNVDATVTLSLFSQTGAAYTYISHDAYLISALGTPFTLAAHESGRFCTGGTSTFNVGYGTIEAKPVNPADGQPFLAAQAFYYSSPLSYSITINDGKPF